MKVSLIVSVLLLFCIPAAFGQNIAVKSNLSSDATTTLNLGAEFGLSSRWTIDFSASYNPWNFSGNRKLKRFFLQPEARYWLCERFNGHFFGVHLLGGAFNIEGFSLPGISRKFRYEGWTGGAGVTYGYQWMIGRRWNLEASLGLGYMYARYDKYECGTCGRKLEVNHTKGFFAPTKACISIIYLIK